MMKHVRNIYHLSLERNSLQTVYLQDTQINKFIHLDNNKITKLEDVKIIVNRNVTDYEISFSGNHISRFTGIPQIWGVKDFFCVDCSIDFVDPFLFANAFNQTKNLILRKNNLNTANIFKTDGTDLQFEEINLRSNQISKIASTDFQNLKHIQKIWIHDNKITTVEPGAFDGLTQLKILLLSYNFIYRLPIDLFRPLVSLEQLVVQANNLAYFQLKDDVFKNLRSLEIYNNPLQCKCLESIRSYTKTHGIILEYDKFGEIKNGTQPECIINDICDPEAGEEFVKDYWQLFNNRRYIPGGLN
ncbi:Leucine-rich repeat [Sergentomyia squamirostris]